MPFLLKLLPAGQADWLLDFCFCARSCSKSIGSRSRISRIQFPMKSTNSLLKETHKHSEMSPLHIGVGVIAAPLAFGAATTLSSAFSFALIIGAATWVQSRRIHQVTRSSFASSKITVAIVIGARNAISANMRTVHFGAEPNHEAMLESAQHVVSAKNIFSAADKRNALHVLHTVHEVGELSVFAETILVVPGTDSGGSGTLGRNVVLDIIIGNDVLLEKRRAWFEGRMMQGQRVRLIRLAISWIFSGWLSSAKELGLLGETERKGRVVWKILKAGRRRAVIVVRISIVGDANNKRDVFNHLLDTDVNACSGHNDSDALVLHIPEGAHTLIVRLEGFCFLEDRVLCESSLTIHDELLEIHRFGTGEVSIARVFHLIEVHRVTVPAVQGREIERS